MKVLRAVMAALVAAALLGAPGSSATAKGRSVALVYRGPASCGGCPEAVAKQLKRSKFHFAVRYVGPDEELKLVPSSFVGVTLYAQPGGDLSVAEADRAIGEEGKQAIKSFVAAGGKYLGFCEGAYLAGSNPGTGMLARGDTRQYINSPGSTVHNARDSLVRVKWGKHNRLLFFQDGPYFVVNGMQDVAVLARYTNHKPAALVTRYGQGWVGVVGPHPEATRSWYSRQLWAADRDRLDWFLAQKLINRTMRGRL